ncbi:hypothetical protein SPRG_06857 [Saprolegnia parasitica CBS 223.65]|uniref:NAD-dependent epimerase/dehydratase domain-containing protein n=1 Tax=Saprolegnia parasitica (strain CBS 223.65) TaxID=695850 RepID=A0A067CA02_SAPPC|nr:hypothetical protein SPRG_06857 [Saprolegnia parasitica CBS 223.65]KDO27589.1 hypothetical protein SPRG_06857 [Saprolegnia parasitica CBS 223.65]|eukprot:XP_012201714.1 hypothetical protein SPRG_06857 [Saprolegnia parasitica CBS 223.65]
MHLAQWADTATSAMCDAALTRRAKRCVFVSLTTAYEYRNGIIDESTTETSATAPIHYFRTKAGSREDSDRGSGRIGHNYILHGPAASLQKLVFTAGSLLGKSKPLLRFKGLLNEFVALFTRREPDIAYEVGYELLPVAESIAKTIDWLRSEKHFP